MFDYVRKHTKIMMGLMFLLIIPSFVLFGIDGYQRMQGQGQKVARVGSHEISQADWDAAHKTRVENLRASMPNIDPKLLDSPASRYATLEALVRERVLQEAAQDAHLLASDGRLARYLQSNPAIAALRQNNGTLDREGYAMLLARQGLSIEGFEARVRADLSAQQVESALLQSGLSAAAPADLVMKAFSERREIQIARFAPADFAAQVKPTEAEIEAFYQANQALFQAPEKAQISYVVLDLEQIKRGITISEQDLRDYYNQNAQRLSGNEERRASHILISVDKSAPEAERQQARARAEALLAQLRKAPDSFAELARKNSQDPGSAAQGGDLNFFPRGAMTPPFEEAVFALKKGEISGVVASDFGFHIIRLTDIKAPKIKTLAELRPSLEADLKNQQAQRKYAEAAEAFTNGVYEQSDSLQPVAERLKLEIRTASDVQRSPAAGASGVLASPKFLAAIFTPEVLNDKRNSEAVETAPSQLAAARVVKYEPAQTLPLSAVRAVVVQRLVAEQAAALARKLGAEKLQAWMAQPAAAALQAAQVVSREQRGALAPQVLNAVMRADADKLPQWLGVDLGEQGYVVARVNKRLPEADLTEQNQAQGRAQYSRLWTQAEAQAYYELLKVRFKVKIMVPRPAGLAG